MKRKPKTILIAVVVIVIGYLILPFLPAYYSSHTYIDIHSGDIKILHRVCNIKAKEEIKLTEFSTLVRKLIDIKKEQEWKYCYGNYLYPIGRGCDDNFKWGGFPSKCKAFADIVDPNHISESELREILQGCLSDMENGDMKSFYDRLDAYMKRNN